MGELDIVIPVGPSDKSVIRGVIDACRKNLTHRRVFLITSPDVSFEGCTTVDENAFSFGDVYGVHPEFGEMVDPRFYVAVFRMDSAGLG